MKLYGRTVVVNDDNIERALRKFKKKISQSGILNDVREHEFYVKPTVKKKLKKSQAKSRWSKYLKSQELSKKNY